MCTMCTSTLIRPVGVILTTAALLSLPSAASAQDASTVDLMLRPGRSMRVARDARVAIHHVGQPITGRLGEPVYVYDRIVLPIGCRLTGHTERIEQPSKKKRTLAIAEG